MAEQDDALAGLEQRLGAAVERIESFVLEHRAMRARHQQLVAERAELVDKANAARSRVETMIERLKNMEAP
jgi:cell division protein ZapB